MSVLFSRKHCKCSHNKLTKNTLSPFLLSIILVLVLTGCNNSNSGNKNEVKQNTYISKSSFLLNTIVTIQLYDKQDQAILEECFDLIKKYEAIFSRTLESSELYALNNGTAPHDGLTYQISDEMSEILTSGLYYGKLSGGTFDISIEPISSLWNFTSETPVLPSEEDIKKALPLVNYKDIQLNGKEMTFAAEGMGIDLGGIAKGFIADKIKDLLLSEDVKSAVINLGGNVLCVGAKPDGSPFKIGIQKPFADRNEIVATMEITDLSVVSSGIYERFFTVDGVSYHHILDPKTGYPYNTNLVSVTIISPASVDGDGLSTTCFALGLDKGLALIESLKDTYAVFITTDYVIHYSKGFDEAIKFKK